MSGKGDPNGALYWRLQYRPTCAERADASNCAENVDVSNPFAPFIPTSGWVHDYPECLMGSYCKEGDGNCWSGFWGSGYISNGEALENPDSFPACQPNKPYPPEFFTDDRLVPGFESNMHVSLAMEHPVGCNLVPPDATNAVAESTVSLGGQTLYSDTCDFQVGCVYEENHQQAATKDFWFDAVDDDIVFYVSSDPIEPITFAEGLCYNTVPDDDAFCGDLRDDPLGEEMEGCGSPNADYIDRECKNNYRHFTGLSDRSSYTMVQATVVDRPPNNGIPLRLHLQLQYWQRTEEKKEILKGKLHMRDYIIFDMQDTKLSTRGRVYDLRFTLIPMTWFQVLNAYALSIVAYAAVFCLVDASISIVVLIGWGAMRFTSKSTSPPKLNWTWYMKNFELLSIKGSMYGVVTLGWSCVVIKVVVVDVNLLYNLVGEIAQLGTDPSADQRAVWQRGRVGFCLLTLGIMTMANAVHLMIPREDNPESVWKPGYWQRRHVMFTSVTLFLTLMVMLEFSFTAIFSTYATVFLFGFKILYMACEMLLAKYLQHKLLLAPFLMALQMNQFVMTLGGEGLTLFITAFLIEMGVAIVKRAVIEPLKFRSARLVKLKIQIQTAQLKGEAPPMMTPEREATGLLEDMVQGMFWFGIESLALIASGVIIVCMYWFKKELEISKLYGMREDDLIFYFMFSFIIIPFQYNIDIFLHNILELVHGWKLHDYLAFCNERYKKRTRRWMGLDTELNEEIAADLRTLDHMCFSDQFYFMSSLQALGIMLSVFGNLLVERSGYNMFRDPGVAFLAPSMIIGSKFYRKAIFKIVDRYKLWWVEGEKDTEIEYDDGPGSRGRGDLPEGMAAVDEDVAQAIEDAYNVGYSIEQLVQAIEDLAYIPPGTSIQGVTGLGGQIQKAGGASAPGGPPFGGPGGPGGLAGLNIPPPPGPSNTGPPITGGPMAARGAAKDVEQGFEDFMDAFRREVEDKTSETKKARFVPSTKTVDDSQALAKATIAPGIRQQDTEGASDFPDEMGDMMGGEGYGDDSGEESNPDWDDWPDELMTGIADVDRLQFDGGDEEMEGQPPDSDYESEGDSDEWPDELMI